MRLSADEARRLCASVLTRHGLAGPDAAVVADSLVEAELRGRPTHGLMRVPGVVEACKRLPAERPAIVVDHGAAACLDGRGGLGYVAGAMASDEAVRRVAAHGLALVAVRHVSHTGMLGYFVDRVARAGHAALAFADCRPLTPPHGAIQPVLGTNPIAAAFPWNPFPILIDTGTTAITFGEVRLAQDEGRALPPGAAIDREGKPTTDPHQVWEGAVLPWAGPRGYIFGLLSQLMAGVLTQSSGLPTRANDYGLLLFACRTNLFGPRSVYEAEMARLADAIHGARRAPGVGRILLPGERAHEERERRLAEGIEISDNLYRKLAAL